MTQIAHAAAGKSAPSVKRAAESAPNSGMQAVQAIAEAEQEVVRRASEATAELGEALMEVVREQTRHNLDAWTALAETVDWDLVARTVDWDRVLRIQGEFLQTSLERTARLTQRYLEMTQAVIGSAAAAATAADQARKAA